MHRHVALYQVGGDEALIPRKRGPKIPPNLTAAALEDEIVAWRKRLDDDALDAGARTISWHMAQGGAAVPALSTIHRVLVRRGLVTPQPQKRPRSSWMRFESDLPNETWQSDMTHWHLIDDQPVEIINFIDDHSRAVLASVAVPVATAADHPASVATVFPGPLPEGPRADNHFARPNKPRVAIRVGRCMVDPCSIGVGSIELKWRVPPRRADVDRQTLIEFARVGYQTPMPITRRQLRSQARALRSAAETLLMGELPLSDGEQTYLVGVVDFSDEFLGGA